MSQKTQRKRTRCAKTEFVRKNNHACIDHCGCQGRYENNGKKIQLLSVENHHEKPTSTLLSQLSEMKAKNAFVECTKLKLQREIEPAQNNEKLT